MLIRVLAVVLLAMVQMPVSSVVLADGDIEAFKAAYGRYQTALEADNLEAASAAAAQALELGKLVFADDSPSLLALYVNHGDLLIDLQRYSEAVPLLQEPSLGQRSQPPEFRAFKSRRSRAPAVVGKIRTARREPVSCDGANADES